jgi:hypothetical protein
MEYTQQEQNDAIKTLSNLVRENQKLKADLQESQQFVLRMFLAGSVDQSEKQIAYYDDGVIDYKEDFEQLLPYFFFDFSMDNLKNGELRESTFSIRIKDGTPFPKIGNRREVLERLLKVQKELFGDVDFKQTISS